MTLALPHGPVVGSPTATGSTHTIVRHVLFSPLVFLQWNLRKFKSYKSHGALLFTEWTHTSNWCLRRWINIKNWERKTTRERLSTDVSFLFTRVKSCRAVLVFLKGKMKRHCLIKEETLSSRMADSCNDVPMSDLYSFSHHSKRQTIKCYTQTPFWVFHWIKHLLLFF